MAGSLGDDWELSAGLRLEYTYYDYDNRASDGPPAAHRQCLPFLPPRRPR